jgi:murein L,D-transpeptidase YafK
MQLRNSRVAQAKSYTDHEMRKEFEAMGLQYPPSKIYIRAFKKEGILEIWVADWSGYYRKYRDFTVCAVPGSLGPKRRQGDKQVPEGFYYLSKFNPQSNFYLSLKVSYPNESDRILGRGGGSLGGDIYIHGECQTVGCLPLNDDIMHVYWLAVQAKSNGQRKIPIHIFPYKFNNYQHDSDERSKHASRRSVIKLWDNLKTGYDFFEQKRKVPKVSVDKRGRYSFY